LRGEIGHLLPKIPSKRNGKRIACIGAGPASLTVANDLMPLGLRDNNFSKNKLSPAGSCGPNIPAFRLPEHVLGEEVAAILNMGVDIRFNTPVESMQAVLDGGFDAIFVVAGRRAAKNSICQVGLVRSASTSASIGWNRSLRACDVGGRACVDSSAWGIPPWIAAAPREG